VSQFELQGKSIMLDRIRINRTFQMENIPMKPKRPRDANQLAKSIVDLATGEASEMPTMTMLNIHAVELGRLGGLKGGKARAKKLSKEQRVKIAKAGARARWKKK
jgi:hypothetical protein